MARVRYEFKLMYQLLQVLGMLGLWGLLPWPTPTS